MLSDRPKRLTMLFGAALRGPNAFETGPTASSDAGGCSACFRCLGSNIGTQAGELMLLTMDDRPISGHEQPPPDNQDRPPGSVQLVRCKPPARRGFAAFSTAKAGTVSTTGMVAVCSVYPEQRWERAFNRWYNHHIEEVLARGIFYTAHRYVTVEPEGDRLRRHWAFYETDRDDAPAFLPGHVRERRREEGSLPSFYPPYVHVLGSSVYEVVRA